MVIASNRVVDPARVLVQCLVVIERKHLSLLVALILLFLRLSDLFKRCRLLRRFSTILASATILLLLFILLIEESEVVRILAFALARIGIMRLVVLSVRRLLLVIIIIHFHKLLLFLAVCWRALLVTDRLVTLITNKYAIA